MYKSILALIIFLVFCFGGLGFMEGYLIGKNRGYEISYNDLLDKIESSEAQINIYRYKIALTNTRACILAMDSGLIRFLDEPEKGKILQLAARAVECERWWNEVMELSPNNDKDTYLSESRWFYDYWQKLISSTVQTRIKMLELKEKLIHQSDKEVFTEYSNLSLELSDQKTQLKKFRDQIELWLIGSWK